MKERIPEEAYLLPTATVFGERRLDNSNNPGIYI